MNRLGVKNTPTLLDVANAARWEPCDDQHVLQEGMLTGLDLDCTDPSQHLLLMAAG